MRERHGKPIVERVAAADVRWKQLVWLMCGLPVEVAPPPLRTRPWATWALAGLITAVSVCGFGFGDEAFDILGFVPAQLWRFGGLTLATAFFLHENAWHLLVNLYFLLMFGDDVEDRLGRGRYLALIAVSALAGGLAHAAIDPRSTIPVIGASGGISGVLAFYALRFRRRRLRWVLGFAVPVRALRYGLVFEAQASVVLAMWLVLQLIGAAAEITEGDEGGVAYLVHLAGAAAGVVFWCLLQLPAPRLLGRVRSRSRRPSLPRREYMSAKRFVLEAVLLLCLVAPCTSAIAQDATDLVDVVLNSVPTPPIAFVGIAPCRLADTRGNGFTGLFGPPSLVGQLPGGASRFFPVAGNCGIPLTAQAVSANLAVTNTTAAGFISIWPGGDPQPSPLVASMNYSAGQTIANAVLAPLGNGGIEVFARATTDLVSTCYEIDTFRNELSLRCSIRSGTDATRLTALRAVWQGQGGRAPVISRSPASCAGLQA